MWAYNLVISLGVCLSVVILKICSYHFPFWLYILNGNTKEVKFPLCLTNYYVMEAYGWVDVWIHVFLTSVLVGGEWSASHPSRVTSGERTISTAWTGGWVCPRTGLDNVEERKIFPLLGIELWPLDHASRNQSLYRLRCPGSLFF
jgi:hypothetical protein